MASKYVKGQVASVISGNKKSPENGSVNDKLVSLFSAPPKKRKAVPTTDAARLIQDAEPSTKKQKKWKKQKRADNHEAVKTPTVPMASSPSPGFSPPPGIIHEALSQQQPSSDARVSKKRKREAEDEKAENQPAKRKPRHRQRDKSKYPCTVFVGNLPLDVTKKVVKKLFKQFGEIENLRFRCPPVAEQGMTKRESITTKKFHPKRDNMVCYVCFKEEESAQKATELNGYVLNEHHLRVDLASNSKKHDNKLSVFVGNLPFDIREDTLREFFKACGDITNVRVIRDSATSIGKGIAYVAFKSKDGVENALRLNGQAVKGRAARVSRCQSKSKLKKTAEKAKAGKEGKEGRAAKDGRAGKDNKAHKGFRNQDRQPDKQGKAFLKKKDRKTKDFPGKKMQRKGRKEDDKGETKNKKIKFLPTNMVGRTFLKSLGRDQREKKMRKKTKLKMKRAREDGVPGMAVKKQGSKKFNHGHSSKSGGKTHKKFAGAGKKKQGNRKFKNKG